MNDGTKTFPPTKARRRVSVPTAFGATFFVCALVVTSSPSCLAAPRDGRTFELRGDVADAADGKPISAARVSIVSLGSRARVTTATSPDGSFAVEVPAARSYDIDASARGYLEGNSSIVSDGDVAPQPTHLLLRRSLRPIGAAVVRSPGATSGLRANVSDIAASGALRVADNIAKLPGVTFSGDGLAPGGDAYLSIRGLRASEGQVELDGHPIGPIGVAPTAADTDGTIAGFNYQAAPYFALRSVDASFGTAAEPAYGVAGIGGSIELRTLTPTRAAGATIAQGIGNEGRSFTEFQATGSNAKLGYALAYGVSGTYGLFPGNSVAQTGLRGTDLTSATLRALTYGVSGDYVLRNTLSTLTYAPLRNVSVSATAYDATSWSDKTGEGDNDFNPYAYTLANAPVGASPACPHGVAVTNDAGPACLSPSAYASAASGPAGGGPGAWQSLRNQDYGAKIAATPGAVTLGLDTFIDSYSLLYHRDASAISGPLDTFLDHWSTTGISFDARMALRKNAFHVGAAWLSQTLDGDASTFDDAATRALTPDSRVIRSAFAEDVYSLTPTLSVSARAFASAAQTALRFNPEFSTRYRPDTNDTFHFEAGRITEDPSLAVDRVDLLPIGAINPDCGAIALASPENPAYVAVGSAPASNLRAESATDVELGYARTFGSAGGLGATLYAENLTDRIVTAELPAGLQLPGGALAPLNARVQQFCGLAPAAGSVAYTLSRSFNAASGRQRGIEISGNAKVASHVALEYAYGLESAEIDGVPDSVLKSDPTLVNGAQVFEVPMQKATFGIDVTAGKLEAKLEGHAVGRNNPQQLPGYAYADASIQARPTNRIVLDVEFGNVFDSHAQTYGLVGQGVPYETNAYFAALHSPFDQEYNERYGLAPTSITAGVSLRL